MVETSAFFFASTPPRVVNNIDKNKIQFAVVNILFNIGYHTVPYCCKKVIMSKGNTRIVVLFKKATYTKGEERFFKTDEF